MLKAAFLFPLLAAAPVAAAPDEAPALRLEGSLQLESDNRFRGVSQSNLLPAVGANLTLRHRSGVYFGADVTTAAGWGQVGGAPVQLLLRGGYQGDVLGAQLDAGFRGYIFPGGKDGGFVELGADLAGFIGPVSLGGGIAWAPPQAALGNWSGTPDSRPGATGSNLYLRADAAAALIGTPLTVIGHVGHSQGSAGLGPQGWALSPTGAYWDWRLGLDCGLGPITLGIAWVATDIDTDSLAYRQLQPGFAGNSGAPLGGSQVVLSVSFAF